MKTLALALVSLITASAPTLANDWNDNHRSRHEMSYRMHHIGYRMHQRFDRWHRRLDREDRRLHRDYHEER